MRNPKHDCLTTLQTLGITFADACALRRISMTLHRWHELECGDGNGAIERDQKWAIERCGHGADKTRWWDGTKWVARSKRRTYDDYEKTAMMKDLPTTRQWDSADFAKANSQGFPSKGAWRETGGKPYWRSTTGDQYQDAARYAVADREKGARKRLAAILARYPTLTAYVQGDPRGASLYILRPSDVPEGADVSAYYSRGVAVYK